MNAVLTGHLHPVQAILLLLPNSMLTTALTLTSPGLKRDGGPRLSDLKVRGQSLPLASRRVPSSYSITGTLMVRLRDIFTSLRNQVWLHSTDQIGFVKLYVGM
jgi:hypothetical protein